ncbi:hypothetical protein A3K82_00800 [Candidatus Pacearchaeota archaeon RBG_19FT_COMBO_34_9]|nr:MAG: hypothetical protein A3K82_00800 [Candidatus Pacearchaeota archaeon RBG_19FT_COMBO_34_9]OGJ16565.1 MAG: hypothetical protein A3K74_00475 [Candidatus Pacearchaeota archaeon RBG_13_33_26]
MKKKEENFEHQNHPVFRMHSRRTLGQKAADQLTKIAGSWIFILSLFAFLLVWMIINSYIFMKYAEGGPFDPYPFILLNLVLSCLAAIQAPIILMSQNRLAQRDRIKIEYDYRINKKAEEEIREIKNLLLKMKKK